MAFPVVRGGIAAVMAAAVLVGACGGSDDQKSFKVDLQSGDDLGAIYSRSVQTAVAMCIADEKLEAVSWSFEKEDQEKPVVQQYVRDKQPSFILCTAARSSGQAPGTSQAGEEEAPTSGG